MQAFVIFALCIVASASDMKRRIIPDILCVLVFFAGLINFSPANLYGMLVAVPLLIAAIMRPGEMGGGDIKYTAALGSIVGFVPGISALILSLTLVLVFFLARHKKDESLPLAPFLSAGFYGMYILTFIRMG